MDVYMFQADLWCDDCAEKYMRENEPPEGADLEDEYSYESDDWPKGPCGDGGGEADGPCHCGACGIFLENPLTDTGRASVIDILRHRIGCGAGGDPEILTEWADFYGITLDDLMAPR